MMTNITNAAASIIFCSDVIKSSFPEIFSKAGKSSRVIANATINAMKDIINDSPKNRLSK